MVQKIRKRALLGSGIRTYRTKQGLTQEQMTAKLQLLGCNISRGTYAKIEAGIRNIDVSELNTILRMLHISYEDLLDPEE